MSARETHTVMPDPEQYLARCEAIDFDHPSVASLAADLAAGDTIDTAQQCFKFVRDEILHSADFRQNPVTYAASAVLQHRTGYCYAKSHLLCALLRANEIPAGLCYQRLSIDGQGAPYCLHGLCAIHLPEIGWYRADARGNRDDVDAQFDPPMEQLAFRCELPGEYDLPEIHVSPLPAITKVLTTCQTWDEVANHLPDWSAD